MSDDNNFKKYILEYSALKNNHFTFEYTDKIFGRTIKKNHCKTTKGETKSERKIIYKGNFIGGMKGTKPSTTSKKAVKICKDNAVLSEYLKVMGIPSSLNSVEAFNIRVTIIEGKYVAALLKIPIHVIGDGNSTIEYLIEKKNAERERSAFFRKSLIQINKELKKNLSDNQLNLDTVLDKDTVCILKEDYNVLNGAESLDITSELSEAVKQEAIEAAACIPGLYTAAVDLKLSSIDAEKSLITGISTEINSLMHFLPYKGESIYVLDDYIQSLVSTYKKNSKIELSPSEQEYQKYLNDFKALKNQYKETLFNYSDSQFEDLVSNKNVLSHLKRIKETVYIENSIDNIQIDRDIFDVENDRNTLDIQEKYLLRLYKPADRTKEIADKALANEIIPFPKFDSVPLDENYYYTNRTKKYGASYQLYIQSQRVCNEILNEFERTNDIRYLLKVKEILYLWIDFISKGTNEKMIWYDHPTGNRAQVIIHFLYLAKQNDVSVDEDLFKAVLSKHGEVLMDDASYKNNNHGLMMDKALMVLGNVLSNELFFKTGYYRSIDTFWYSFSSKGTHLENSPDYHNMVVKMYTEINEYLKMSGKSFSQPILGYLNLTHEYLDIIKRPNNKLPAIGDSNETVRKTQKYYQNFCDAESGMGVLQYDSDKPFYVNFVCGYSSRVHKHKDDLSVNLNYNGEDFIVDAGKFNYNGKSPTRKYVISKNAHSSFSLKDYNYSIDPENRFSKNVQISGYNFGEKLSFIKGIHKDYKSSEAVLSRTVIQITQKPILLIVDDVESANDLDFIQNFNLHEKIEVEDNGTNYYLKGNKETLLVKQFNVIDDVSVISGDKEIPVAVNTVGFGQVVETKQLQYYKSTHDKNVFLTAVYDDKVINNLKISYNNSKLEIILDNEEYIMYI